ncbi:hypothetical protein N7486_009473 [Penicillium sp. IBT 16267x]|nr:hypothetical protein N7486_009473 [Penicillium sp. IBT 16267x]
MEKKDALAMKFDESEDYALGSLATDDKKLIRKIDSHILPIMFLTYFLRMIDKISSNMTSVTEIKLADSECLPWDNQGGWVTLAGDAAHAMTMYRGEAANHGLLDAYHLMQAIDKLHSGTTTAQSAIDDFEQEMRT